MEITATPRPRFTSRIGMISGIDFASMIKILGAPERCDTDNKVEIEWSVKTSSGTTVIWNWKDGPEYLRYEPRTDDYYETLFQVNEWSCWWENMGVLEDMREIFGDSFKPDR